MINIQFRLLAQIIVLMGVVSTAQAEVTDLGTLPVPTNVTINDNNLAFGSFSDTFSFQVNGNAAVIDTQNSVYFSGSGSFESYSAGVQLSSVALYQGGNAIELATVTPTISYNPIPGLGTTYSYNTSLSYIPVSVGQQYSLVVSGTVLGNTPGSYSYSGTLTTISVPVPEPSKWALVLVGIGLVGLQVRRKQRIFNLYAVRTEQRVSTTNQTPMAT